jgi:hypothetical protein
MAVSETAPAMIDGMAAFGAAWEWEGSANSAAAIGVLGSSAYDPPKVHISSVIRPKPDPTAEISATTSISFLAT